LWEEGEPGAEEGEGVEGVLWGLAEGRERRGGEYVVDVG